jgi:hypothetical protein
MQWGNVLLEGIAEFEVNWADLGRSHGIDKVVINKKGSSRPFLSSSGLWFTGS